MTLEMRASVIGRVDAWKRTAFSAVAIFTGVLGAGVLGVTALGAPASADGRVARHTDWDVFVRSVDGDRVCYASSPAQDASPRSVEHGQVVAVVSSWESGAGLERPQISFGYAPREKGPTRARVGRKSWSLYTVGGDAFADDYDEPDMVAAMRKGSVLRVETTTETGELTAYEFSLKGITAALRDVKNQCG